ncbi:DUF3267 domain-containing protein [Olsenella massiliensis]|uniref:DUF3267 domain-containing protein n=1 Tax=Olsenella massiliensis TaxID=1622075 RepID=UPI0009EC8C99|nr:DUF3267 domain-containing protein [Olsenella massiliensis]
MRTLCEIDVLGDEGMRRRMGRFVLVTLVVGAAVALALVTSGVRDAVAPPVWAALLLTLSLVALPLHELVHAAAFKLLGPPGTRVRLGAQEGMLYACAAGTLLSRRRFMAVLVAPALLASVAFFLLCVAASLPLLAWCCGAVHLAGCAGDLIMAGAIWRERGCSHVRDTERGIELMG